MSRCGGPQELQQAPMQGNMPHTEEQQQKQPAIELPEPLLQRILALAAEADKRMLHTAPLVCRAWCNAIVPPRELRICGIGHDLNAAEASIVRSVCAWLRRNVRGGAVEALALKYCRRFLPALDAALLPRLRSLTLTASELCCESAEAVAAHLPQLEVLAVESGALHPGAATALACLTNLRSLSLQRSQLNQQDVIVLAGALSQLTRLDIGFSRNLQAVGPGSIAALTGLRQLADLSVAGSYPASAARVSVLTGLTRLALSDCCLLPEDLLPLVSLTRLRHLDLTSNPLYDCLFDDVLLPLTRALTQLTCLCMGALDFDAGVVNPAGIQALKRLTALAELDVSKFGIDAAGAQQLAGALPNLASLSVRGCSLGPQGLAALAAGLTKLTRLVALDNGIGGEAASAAAVQSLTKLQGLRHLALGGNRLSLEECVLLTALTGLTCLVLSDNRLPWADQQALTQRLTPQASQVWQL